MYAEYESALVHDIDQNDCDSECAHSAGTNDQCDENAVQFDRRFIVPVYINNVRCSALRDSGSSVAVIVDKNLVSKDHVNHEKTIKCVGLFCGGKAKRIPTAVIKIRSPWFNVDGDIEVTAAVTDLPAGLFCILGNPLFSDPRMLSLIHI